MKKTPIYIYMINLFSSKLFYYSEIIVEDLETNVLKSSLVIGIIIIFVDILYILEDVD